MKKNQRIMEEHNSQFATAVTLFLHCFDLKDLAEQVFRTLEEGLIVCPVTYLI